MFNGQRPSLKFKDLLDIKISLPTIEKQIELINSLLDIQNKILSLQTELLIKEKEILNEIS